MARRIRGRRLTFLIAIVATIFACGSKPAHETKRITEGPKLAGKTAVPCIENSCTDEKGCATCVTFEVKMPTSAKVIGVHCYTNAHYPNDYGQDDLHEVQCGEDVGWSVFDVPSESLSGGNRFVRTTYHNRSNDRERQAKLEVAYQE